jgi:hypothetical protein
VTATSITAAGDLKPGNTLVVTPGTGSPFANAPLGAYIWDGTNWLPLGGGTLPDATTTAKGVVKLALDTDVLEAGAPAQTTPDPLAVATAAQLKALAGEVGALATGHALLGTYDASTSGIATANAEAARGSRAGFTTAAKISSGTGAKPGDYFVVTTAGTPTGDAAAINVALKAGDQILFDGQEWRIVGIGTAGGGDLLHGLVDVNDSAVATVADIKGLLVRDNAIADGLPGAYRLVSVLDCGTIP